jgi:hypothetical protein
MCGSVIGVRDLKRRAKRNYSSLLMEGRDLNLPNALVRPPEVSSGHRLVEAMPVQRVKDGRNDQVDLAANRFVG